MATEYVSRAFLEIDGTVIEAKEASYKVSQDQELVNTMNKKRRSTGYIDGIPTFELSVVIPLPQDGHAINFDKMMLDGTLFETKYEYEGGQARSFTDCKIKDVDNPSREGEGTDTTLTIDALDMFLN